MSWFKRMLYFETSTVATSAVVVGIGTALNGIFSLLRNALLASRFGTSQDLDTYFLAFRIPDLIFTLISMGIMSAIVIPTFAKFREEDTKRSWEFIDSMVTTYLAIGVVLAVIFEFGAPWIMRWLAPGFSPQALAQASFFSRVLMFQPIFLGISAIFSGVLQTLGKFFVTSFAPILYTLGIIIGILFFTKTFGIFGVVFGVVLGAFFHLFTQWVVLRDTGFKYHFIIPRGEEFVKLMSLALPRILDVALFQLNILFMTVVLSRLHPGSLSVFNFANDLYGYALNIFAVSLSVASFPMLSTQLHRSRDLFMVLFRQEFKKLFVVAGIFFFLYSFFGDVLVRITLQYGVLHSEAASEIAAVLSFLGIGVFASALLPYFVRISFIFENTFIPLLTSVFGTGVFVLLISSFVARWGVPGAALALSIGNYVDVILLGIFLMMKMRQERVPVL